MSVPNTRNAPHALVPDIQAYNFPTGRQSGGHNRSTPETPAIFKVKTYTGYKTRYHHPNTVIPADRRARVVLGEYTGKFRRLDKKFASDVVGNITGPVVGSFTWAQSAFYTKQVIPLCAGWFGEVNKEFIEVIRVLTRAASTGELGLSISPLANSDKKGGVYPIKLNQFKHALGVTTI